MVSRLRIPMATRCCCHRQQHFAPVVDLITPINTLVDEESRDILVSDVVSSLPRNGVCDHFLHTEIYLLRHCYPLHFDGKDAPAFFFRVDVFVSSYCRTEATPLFDVRRNHILY